MSSKYPEEFVPDPQVARELGVSLMAIWRYTRDPDLNFPPPIKVRSKNYRSRRLLEEWKAEQMRRSIEERAAKPKRKKQRAA